MHRLGALAFVFGAGRPFANHYESDKKLNLLKK